MKDVIPELVNNLIECGPVKIDNPIVEMAVGLATAAILGAFAYKVCASDKAKVSAGSFNIDLNG